MAREALYNFEPEEHIVDFRRAEKIASQTVSINLKYNTITFSKEYVKAKGLDGKFIKFYIDKSKKAIGWKILHERDTKKLRGYRKVVCYKVEREGKEYTNCPKLTIKKLIEVLHLQPDKKYINLEIKKYVKPTQFLDDYPDDIVDLNIHPIKVEFTRTKEEETHG